MSQIDISTGKLSNRVTRMLDISVDAPECAILKRKIIEYPERLKRELDILSADLDEKYAKVVEEQNSLLAQHKERLYSIKQNIDRDISGKKGSILSMSEQIDQLNSDIESLTISIKKDVRAIRWMNFWRVIWGILCTAGIVVVGFLIVAGFIFKIIGIFMSSSRNDD